MNTFPRVFASRRSGSGMALVIVLSMLMLVAVLVVAFLNSTAVELRAVKSYASGADARSMADEAIHLVISQIQDATTTPNLAWASQPGMIRTYDNNGKEVTAYKLFSSSTLRVNNGYNAVSMQASEIPSNWASNPAAYVDLNEPMSLSGADYYPIVNPSAVAANVSGGAALTGILPAIEGCYLDTTNPATALNPSSKPPQRNPVPMPVQWLYLLTDGTIIGADSNNKIAGASKTNPIVGRIAYWTDDECSKVNINTASEGTFWDRPRTEAPSDTSYERLLAVNMPIQNEFQRYSGHPAMTCLSVVFPALAGESTHDYNERIYDIIPRIVGGGSESGTARYGSMTTGLTIDNDRLFASTDELMFKAGTTVPRTVNFKGPGVAFTQDDIDRARFFLTATSRAPEVNMFNRPRIALWPLQLDPDPNRGVATRNSKDKLIAFCSTVGKTPYYFQRYNTYDPSINARGTSPYLGNMQNPIPSSQSPTMDWDKVPRNQALFKYLLYLSSHSIPGLGGKLDQKYPTTLDQILTEMFDFVRSMVNVISTGATPVYFYAPGTTDQSYIAVTGQNQVVPLVIKPNGSLTHGFGRFSTVTQAAINFYASQKATSTTASQTISAVLILDPFNASPGFMPWCSNVRYVVTGLSQLKVDNGVSEVNLDFPDPAVNLVTARDLNSNATARTGLEYALKYYDAPNSQDAPKTLGKVTLTDVGTVNEEKYYPFATATASAITAPNPTLTFSGGDITIQIYPGYAKTLNATDCIQTIHMYFPKTVLPRPYNTNGNLMDFNNRLAGVNPGNTKQTVGIEVAYGHNPRSVFVWDGGMCDVVRSVEARYGGPAKGDYRVFSLLSDVPNTYFEGHGLTDPATDGTSYTAKSEFIHSIRPYPDGNMSSGSLSDFYIGVGGPKGLLLSSVNTYYASNSGLKGLTYPIVPRGLTAAVMANGALGDWDTGPGVQPDGPYINKPEENNNYNPYGPQAGDSAGFYTIGRDATNANFNEQGATFSPNRQISSAVAFGSLPTGVDPSSPSTVKPWQTLLFCKNPAAGSQHPGFGSPASGPPYTTPPDHAFLDFFWMPIIEPYAISEPFSTAGKVNMNYQMVPFTYLTRSTALRAVLKSTRMMAIPQTDGVKYKARTMIPGHYRYTINPDEKTGTLKGFENRFASGDIFRSSSEICDIYLIPGLRADGASPSGGPIYSTMNTWWNTQQLTGDNVREFPYGHIYPRLTTKSNTYTIHMRAQSLKKAINTAPDQFITGQDQITGEYRGSATVERYLDPNSDGLVKADNKTTASETDADAMVGPYKIRVIGAKRFSP